MLSNCVFLSFIYTAAVCRDQGLFCILCFMFIFLYVSDNLVAMAEKMTDIVKGTKERLSNITGNVFHVVAENNSLIR